MHRMVKCEFNRTKSMSTLLIIPYIIAACHVQVTYINFKCYNDYIQRDLFCKYDDKSVPWYPIVKLFLKYLMNIWF